MEPCNACLGTGLDLEAEFDRLCLVCGGRGEVPGTDDILPAWFGGVTNEEGEVYGG